VAKQKALRILGVRIDDVTTKETLETFDAWIAEGTPHQVVTVNPEFVMRAQQDREFAVVLEEASLALPDGQGLLHASQVMGRPLRERVTGSDTLPLVAKRASSRGYRLFLLGAGPGVAERAAQKLTNDCPGLQIAGTYAGSPDPTEDAVIVARIKSAHPDVLFVAYGAPQQDLWINRNLENLGVPVCMGIGGAFDFVAGVTRRAPVWMRRLGVEWLYRLLQEPWRWRRMLALPRFVLAVLRERLSGNRRRSTCVESR